MENTKKENVLLRMFNSIKRGWDRLGVPDINDGIETDADIAKEVKKIEQVQAEVHEQKGFVPRAKVNEGEAQVVAQGKAKNKGNSQVVRGNA